MIEVHELLCNPENQVSGEPKVENQKKIENKDDVKKKKKRKKKVEGFSVRSLHDSTIWQYLTDYCIIPAFCIKELETTSRACSKIA